MDRGAWWTTACGVAKNGTHLSNLAPPSKPGVCTKKYPISTVCMLSLNFSRMHAKIQEYHDPAKLWADLNSRENGCLKSILSSSNSKSKTDHSVEFN